MKKKISEAEAIASLKQRLNEVTVEEKPTEQQIDQFVQIFISGINDTIDWFKRLPKKQWDAIVNFYNSIRSKTTNESAFLDFVKWVIKKSFNFFMQRIASALDVMITGTVLGWFFAKLSTMGFPLFASIGFLDGTVYSIFETLWHLLGAFLDYTTGGLLIPAIPGIGFIIIAIALILLINRSKTVQKISEYIAEKIKEFFRKLANE
jgi:hypothetical protein